MTKFAVRDSEAYLKRAFGSGALTRAFLSRCLPKERTALGLVKLHGGALPSKLLTIEAELRGLAPPGRKRNWGSAYDRRRKVEDPTSAMIEALALVPLAASWSDARFPDVVLHPSLVGQVEPALPLPWPGHVLEPPARSLWREEEQVRDDRPRAEYLLGRGTFPVNKHGWPTRPVLKGIAKALRVPHAEPWGPRSAISAAEGLVARCRQGRALLHQAAQPRRAPAGARARGPVSRASVRGRADRGQREQGSFVA